ncbi:MAG: tetraacyldisaccharide 4'-kinase, partial [Burkholderiales bacterium]|nr:tetraacyldisaccharide 4'-kinase [Burkholderiales bacterium]
PGLLAERRLLRAVPLAAWWAGERGRPLDELPAVDWCACAGLAQPQAFFDALRAQGIPLTHTWPRPDHDAFDTLPWPPGAPVLVTEKDAVKLDPGRSGCEQVWVCPLDLLPEPAFAAQLREQLRPLLPTWTPD